MLFIFCLGSSVQIKQMDEFWLNSHVDQLKCILKGWNESNVSDKSTVPPARITFSVKSCFQFYNKEAQQNIFDSCLEVIQGCLTVMKMFFFQIILIDILKCILLLFAKKSLNLKILSLLFFAEILYFFLCCKRIFLLTL